MKLFVIRKEVLRRCDIIKVGNNFFFKSKNKQKIIFTFNLTKLFYFNVPKLNLLQYLFATFKKVIEIDYILFSNKLFSPQVF